MKESAELFQFPCPYPLKVLGKNTNEFLAVVSGIVEKHLSKGAAVTYFTRLSSGEKYLAVTATFLAHSRNQLTAMYDELNRHELILLTF